MKIPTLSDLMDFEINKILILMFTLASFLVVSAFVMEYVFNAKPCPMCWQQRYAHWAIGGLSIIGLVARPYVWKKMLLGTVAIAACVGGAIGLYQSLGQLGWVQLPASCTGGSALAANPADLLAALSQKQDIPDCRDWGMTFFGLSIAMWNFLMMSALVVFLTKWLIVNKDENSV